MKKFLKKTFKWLGILLVLLLALLITLPIIFEDEIAEAIKTMANEEVNAKIDWSGHDLSIFDDFPNLTLVINDVSVAGIDTFEGTELAAIKKMELTIDLMSLMSDEYEIRKIGLEEPNIHVKVLENGMANYDIAKPSTDTTATVEEAASDTAAPFAIALSEYYITSANIIYDDMAGDMYMNIEGLTHRGEGDFSDVLFTLVTTTEMKALTYKMEGIAYMNKASLDLKADIDMDMNNMKFTFKENELTVNELALAFDGFLAMPAEDIDMDINLNAKQTEFKHLLSMVPAVYAKEFASIETSGKMSFASFVKGKYNETTMPGFGLDLNVDDARFHYPDLPKSVENINVDLSVKRDEGPDLDNTVVNMKRFDMSIASNPIKTKLLVTSPISDPNIDCYVKCEVDLENIKDVYPMAEGEEYNGHIGSDLELKGRISALEEERYEDFVAQGKLVLSDMVYRSADMAYDTELTKMSMAFSPQNVTLDSLDAKVGNSDFKGTGRLDNLLSYLFKDEELTGSFDLNSEFVDLVELMAEPEATTTTAGETTASAGDGGSEAGGGEEAVAEEYGAVEVPGNIRFDMNTSIKLLKYPYDEGVILDLENIVGKIKVADNVAYLTDVSVDMLQGNVVMNGSYDTKNPAEPGVDFDFKVVDFDLKQSAETFNTIELVAPFLKKCTGKFSTDLKMSSILGSDFMPDYSTLTGDGKLRSKNVDMTNVDGIKSLAKELKLEKQANQKLENVNMTYEFRDGKIFIEPFDVKLFDNEATISGSTSFEQDMDYDIDMKVDPAKLGGGFNSMASSAIDQLNANGANVSMSKELPVTIKMTGKTLDPKYKVQFGDVEQGSVGDAIKEEIKEQIEEVKEEAIETVKETAGEQAAKILADAQKQADAIKAEARKRAEQVRAEGYAQAEKIEKEAEGQNVIKRKAAEKLADKTRKETDEKADKIIAEGDAKADKVMEEARAKAAAVTE